MVTLKRGKLTKMPAGKCGKPGELQQPASLEIKRTAFANLSTNNNAGVVISQSVNQSPTKDKAKTLVAASAVTDKTSMNNAAVICQSDTKPSAKQVTEDAKEEDCRFD